MIIMGSILAMISTLILLDSIEVESLNVASPRRTRLDLHWLFVVGSFIGRGEISCKMILIWKITF